MEKCKTCGEFVYSGGTNGFGSLHECPPAFDVWSPELGETREDARTVHASDERAAVEKWAQDRERRQCEYDIAAGRESPVVEVTPSGASKVKRWRVFGEMVPEYRARPADGKDTW